MPTKEQVAESLEKFEALLGLVVTCEATNEKASELGECVHKKHQTMFWTRIDFSASKIVFKSLKPIDDIERKVGGGMLLRMMKMTKMVIWMMKSAKLVMGVLLQLLVLLWRPPLELLQMALP
jgi:hypothetical protein